MEEPTPAAPLVRLLVDDELLPELDKMLALIGGAEVGRQLDDRPGTTALLLAMPDVPTGAASMEPVFRSYADGSVDLQHITWFDADGQRITTATTPVTTDQLPAALRDARH